MDNKHKCILHVGTMKTGTTSIQKWLGENSDWLRGQGWYYPGWPLRAADAIREKLSNTGPNDNIVISDEGLWHHSETRRSDTGEIATILSDYAVSVIVYCRRPDLFVESWFKQGLKHGTLGETDVRRFIHVKDTSAESFRRRLDGFCRIFGEENVIVAPYERAQFKDGDLLEDFRHRTGLPKPPDRAVKESHNVSPASETVLMLGMLRQLQNAAEPELRRILNTRPSDLLAASRTSILTAEEAAWIRAEYRPLFREIQQRFGTGSTPEFFENWNDDNEHPPVSPLRPVYDQYMTLLQPK